MSAIARWSYTYAATVQPFVSHNQRTGETIYGGEYAILCSVIGASEQDRVSVDGLEMVAKHTIFTEDSRPKYLDKIKFEGSDGWEVVQHKTFWDMSAFGDAPDYKLTTG